MYETITSVIEMNQKKGYDHGILESCTCYNSRIIMIIVRLGLEFD